MVLQAQTHHIYSKPTLTKYIKFNNPWNRSDSHEPTTGPTGMVPNKGVDSSTLEMRSKPPKSSSSNVPFNNEEVKKDASNTKNVKEY